MQHEFFLKARSLFILVMLLALGGCASGPSAPSNVIACPPGDTPRYTYTFSDGGRYDGHFYCDSRGHGSPAGKGTLQTTDGRVIKADGWGSTANGLPRRGGEVEIRYPNGQTDRFRAPEHASHGWYYDLPARDGSGLLTGQGQLAYTVFPAGHDQWLIEVGGKIALSHPGPRGVQKTKINCGDVPAGYVMTLGNCTNGKPDGKVAFHTPDGLEQLTLSYANGQPSGTLRYAKIHIKSTLEKSNAFLFPNIVSDATNPYGNTGKWLRDVVALDISGVHIAIGTPKVVRSGATTILEFSTLERYTAHQGYGNEIFFGGGTAKLTPYGDGKCEATRYSYDTHQKRSDLSVPLEACSYKHVGIMLRSDDRAVSRRESRDDAEKQRQRESDERWAENQRQRAETARQSAEEDRQSARSTPYVPSAVAGAMKLQQIQRDAERYGAAVRAAQSGRSSAASVARSAVTRPSSVPTVGQGNAFVLSQSQSATSKPAPTAAAEQKRRSDEEHKNELAIAKKQTEEEKAKSDKEAKAKTEGIVKTGRVDGDSLEEHQAKTWCERRVPEYRKSMATSGNKLISIGECSCKPGGAAVSMTKQFRCEFSVTYREFTTNAR